MANSNLVPQAAINSYLDDVLTETEHAALNDWLKADARHAKQFATELLLHDRLRSEHVAQTEALLASCELSARPANGNEIEEPPFARPSRRSLWRSATVVMGALCLLLGVFWYGLADTHAAAVEINRLINANEHSSDRTYQIDVEERREQSADELPLDAPERSRPPKTPIDHAILHVRSGGQFVLIRESETKGGLITGCNGRSSWVVRPNGTAKVSSDPTEFQRDVPGHEHQMPLININIGLSRLLAAYDVRLSPVEEADSSDPSRLIVAVKKRGERGPKRVEISYSLRSGLIRQMRFIDMPFGPEKLTLRMSLVEEQPLGDHFFNHETHQIRTPQS